MQDFIAQFDASMIDAWEPYPRPTQASLLRISTHFNLTLPPQLVELAANSRCFSSFFLSLGEDYGNPVHIITYNAYWRRRRRTRRVPDDLVIVSNGFMDEDFWCLVRSENPRQPTTTVEYWSPPAIGWPKGGATRGPSHPTFMDFLAAVAAPRG